ncbi:biotin synthase BioB [Saccharibacter sp. 17.LH.SD]|nr:biotin synthase BioB [Saccharibacter sp. 17.LH.SD]MXV44488.1 biotin synthase BioB [Saccharibacter sp. 17.LH.SD]
MTSSSPTQALRHDWTRDEVEALLALPFPELIFRAQLAHRQYFDPTKVQISTLLSIKTGGCPEDCAYCPQSAHHDRDKEIEKLLPLEKVIADAKRAKEAGAGRFCMGAAWRAPKDRDLDPVCRMVEEVKALGLETCLTVGMLTPDQSKRLKDAGLDYYNHNLDTSEDFYGKIISTRTYQDRLDTLANVRDAGINVCCGGIIGMGEDVSDRASLLMTLANLPTHPESVPINLLVRVEGTPLADEEAVDPVTFARVIATARIIMPASHVRLAAGRENMSESDHALCFLAGANSIFWGERLLTTPNPKENSDRQLLNLLGMTPMMEKSEALAAS